jgi:glucose/arabinose dehydrogenase
LFLTPAIDLIRRRGTLRRNSTTISAKFFTLRRTERLLQTIHSSANRVVLPEIWAYGVRSPEGLAFDPRTGRLWQNDHGPRGGDELNIIEKGKNYGWP